MKVRYTATAIQEIEDILFYIAEENSSAALKVSLTIVATIARVADFPRTTVETDVPGVSVAPVLPYRYLIFFSVAGDVLIVRNVRHSARRQPDLSEF